MTTRKIPFSITALGALCGAAVLSPTLLSGQEFMGDFMFKPPRVTLSVNFGYGIPSAGSDIFQEVDELFTLDKGDFHAPVVGGGLSIYLNDRMDLAFEASYSRSSTWSEYVKWVDGDDLPIEQQTRFTQIPITASLRYFLMDRGREIGSLSWIPTTWAPYIGVGAGQMLYRFEQVGDFVDFEDLGVFGASYYSKGSAWMGHAFGGVQWAFSPQFVMMAEGRYSLADADLDRNSYVGYEKIDLSGFQASIGFGVRW